MAYIISDNIISPLGATTEANLAAIAAGRSLIGQYEAGSLGTTEPFAASVGVIAPKNIANASTDGLTPFESVVAQSVRTAVEGSPYPIDMGSPRTLLIVSTTKGNIENIWSEGEESRISPADAARKVADTLGIKSEPIAVCNACISGLAAIILANRMIEGGECDTAIVVGADLPRKFIISGFLSLKAMSATTCRPFDIDRNGLNLGEAAATIILGNRKPSKGAAWRVAGAAVRNDAYHISAPHRKGEGLRLAICEAMGSHTPTDLMLVSAHGTATLFNDQMESVAMERAGLGEVPTFSLKGYYGHTMGAAGVVETIVSAHCAEQGIVPASKGFAEAGVSGKMNISATECKADTSRRAFAKMLSGFGGCNAVALFEREDDGKDMAAANAPMPALKTVSHITITPDKITLDGADITPAEGEGDTVTRAYREHKERIGAYPKFFKMDKLSRLGWMATELLLAAESERETGATPRFAERDDRAVIFFNHSSSVDVDRIYADSVRRPDNYFPSPSAFVYTLPNIVTGEIAIRNNYHGETSLYIIGHKDNSLMESVVRASMTDSRTTSVIYGWVDYAGDGDFEADITIALRNS